MRKTSQPFATGVTAAREQRMNKTQQAGKTRQRRRVKILSFHPATPAMKQLYNGLYSYRYWGQVPTCHLRLMKTANRHIAIATQVSYPINTGVTVTWGWEHLATQIVEEFQLDPENTLFIEHWSELKDHLGIIQRERLDIVTFTWKREFLLWGRKYASDPQWKRMQPQKLLELIF